MARLQAYGQGNQIQTNDTDGDLIVETDDTGTRANIIFRDEAGTANYLATDSAGGTLDLGSTTYAVESLGAFTASNGMTVSGASEVFSITATGTHTITGGDVDLDVALDSSSGITNSGGEHLFSGGNLQLNDSIPLEIGTGADDSVIHNGTDTIWTHATGDLIFDNTNTTGSTIVRLGTDTSATDFQVQNNSGSAKFTVTGASASTIVGTNLLIDSGFSLDMSSAVALNIADTTASSLNLARSGVPTNVDGTLIVAEGTTFNGLVTADDVGILSNPGTAATTTDWFCVDTDAVTFTGNFTAFKADYSGATAFNSASNFYGVEVIGHSGGNAGAGDICGVLINADWDQGLVNLASLDQDGSATFSLGIDIDGASAGTTGLTMTGLDLGAPADEIGDIFLDNVIRFAETSDPTAVADKGFLYIKDNGGVSDLYFRNTTTIEQLTGLGATGIDLDEAYSNGRTITGDSGAQDITNSGTSPEAFNVVLASDVTTEAASWTQFGFTVGAGDYTGTNMIVFDGDLTGANSFNSTNHVIVYDGDAPTNAGSGDSIIFHAGANADYGAVFESDVHLFDSVNFALGTGNDVIHAFGGTTYDTTFGTNNIVWNIGAAGGNTPDIVIHGNASGDEVTVDSSGNIWTWDGVDIKVNDNDNIYFGDPAAGDVCMFWNGTDWNMTFAADDTVVNFGAAGGNQGDFVFHTTSGTITSDTGLDEFVFNAAHLHVGDDDEIRRGDAVGGDIIDVFNGTSWNVSPAVTGTVYNIGVDGGASFDIHIHTSTVGDEIVFDESAGTWTHDDVDLILRDNTNFYLGTGNDICFAWDGTDGDVTVAADNTVLNWGVDGGSGLDQNWYGAAAGDAVMFDKSANTWTYADVDVIFEDNTNLYFGTGSDICTTWDGTELNTTAIAASEWNIGDGFDIDINLFGDLKPGNNNEFFVGSAEDSVYYEGVHTNAVTGLPFAASDFSETWTGGTNTPFSDFDIFPEGNALTGGEGVNSSITWVDAPGPTTVVDSGNDSVTITADFTGGGITGAAIVADINGSSTNFGAFTADGSGVITGPDVPGLPIGFSSTSTVVGYNTIGIAGADLRVASDALTPASPGALGTEARPWTTLISDKHLITGTSGGAITAGAPVYLNGSGEYVEADASAESTSIVVGICTDGASGASETVTIAVSGKITVNGTLSAGDEAFLSETAGTVTATPPTTTSSVVKPLGYMVTSTVMAMQVLMGIVNA
jgi:hypothetical protein